MSIQSIDEGIARYYDLKSTKGVIVTRVIPNSPADEAGIKTGDIILEIEGYKINNENTIFGVFQEFRVGQTITLKILRDNTEITKRMKLVKK
jgi:serine protease Do